MRHDAIGRIERKAVTAELGHLAGLLGSLSCVGRQYQEMNGICGGTTHPRMTTAPTLILGAMARAVTTAELSALLMLRRILRFPYAFCRDGHFSAALQIDSQIQISA